MTEERRGEEMTEERRGEERGGEDRGEREGVGWASHLERAALLAGMLVDDDADARAERERAVVDGRRELREGEQQVAMQPELKVGPLGARAHLVRGGGGGERMGSVM